MKFGKRIRSEAVQSWEEDYVDYKGLKHLLKPLVEKGCPAELEDEFRKAILAEIEKDKIPRICAGMPFAKHNYLLTIDTNSPPTTQVDCFFSSKELELYNEFRNLCEEVSRTHLENHPAQCSSLDKLVGALEGTPAGTLVRKFLSFSARVDSMRKFIMMNTLAVVKITKKHDKQSSRQLQWEMVSAVHKRHFYNSQRFGSLITDIEVLASQIMYRLTNSKPLPESYSCPICLGILCNPVVLSCGHRFCMKCVSAASYFCQTSCPVCRKEQILDMETIKVDSLLSHFLDRYFPEGQTGVKQCSTCAYRKTNPDSADGPRRRLPCEECTFQVLEALEEMQEATLHHLQREAQTASHCGPQPPPPPDEKPDPSCPKPAADQGSASGRGPAGGGAVGSKREALAEKGGLEVRPRLKRRNVGQGGKQALGGRPGETEDAQAAPVMLSFAMLRAHFNLPLNDAAKRLGVCATAIKKVCRRMGIKQWPHRKLKAVEKRLALLSAEQRYAQEEGVGLQCRSEMRQLEEERESLLQGIDCDVTGEDAGEEAGAAPGSHAEAAGGSQGEGAGSTGAQEEGGRGAGAEGKEREAAEAREEDVMDELDLGELEGLEGGAGRPLEEASEQDVWAMLHRMVDDTPAPLLEGPLPADPLPDDKPDIAEAFAAASPAATAHAPHDHLSADHPARAPTLLLGEAEVPASAPPPQPQPAPPSAAARPGGPAPGHSAPRGAPHPAPHRPAHAPQTSYSQSLSGHSGVSPRTHPPHRGLPAVHGQQQPGAQAGGYRQGERVAGGGEWGGGHGEMLRELSETRQRVGTLEEEVVHLRQFSMALIKERGDLAMQLQQRNQQNMELRAYVLQLESELGVPRNGKRPLREADKGGEGNTECTEWMEDGAMLGDGAHWSALDDPSSGMGCGAAAMSEHGA